MKEEEEDHLMFRDEEIEAAGAAAGLTIQEGQQHVLSSKILHESSEQFSEDIIKNRSLLTYYARHWHYIVLSLFGFSAFVKLYMYQYQLILNLHDHQD